MSTETRKKHTPNQASPMVVSHMSKLLPFCLLQDHSDHKVAISDWGDSEYFVC